MESGKRKVERGKWKVEREMLAEGDGLADVGGVDMTLGIDSMTIAEGALDAPEIHVTLHRTPAATTLDQVLSDSPTRIGTDDDDIGLITLTEEATLAHFEETGRIMTHQLDKTLHSEYPLIYELEHRDKGELYHRHATGSTGTATFFLR
jgi:hypothetical protein